MAMVLLIGSVRSNTLSPKPKIYEVYCRPDVGFGVQGCGGTVFEAGEASLFCLKLDSLIKGSWVLWVTGPVSLGVKVRGQR